MSRVLGANARGPLATYLPDSRRRFAGLARGVSRHFNYAWHPGTPAGLGREALP